jgi:S1-C subfamily serine protease
MKRIISAIVLFSVLSAPAQAGDAPKATPVYKTYTLRNGQVVPMSLSQWKIANEQWRALSPEDIASVAAKITVTISVYKNDGTHILGTGFFINNSDVVTNWHVVRDADSITVVNSAEQRTGALLKFSNPSMDLATITVPNVIVRNWAQFDTDSDWERIGEKVYVYGNPQGMEGTFSDGLLSAWRVNAYSCRSRRPSIPAVRGRLCSIRSG